MTSVSLTVTVNDGIDVINGGENFKFRKQTPKARFVRKVIKSF